MDVITNFNKKTGSFSLFTDDAYVYNREVLKMRVACKSDNAASEVVDEVTVHIRKSASQQRAKPRKASKREEMRRKLQTEDDWTIRWPACQPNLSIGGQPIPQPVDYIIGVDG